MVERADADDARRHAPATARNRAAIGAVLSARRADWPIVPASGRRLLLEVAAGTGEHAAHLAPSMPDLDWLPTEPDPAGVASIAAWRRFVGTPPNLFPPRPLDLAAPEPGSLPPVVSALFTANLTHIAPWAVTEALFTLAGRLLASGGDLLIYGPFVRPGRPTAPSNRAFDQQLRRQDPDWGLRSVARLDQAAAAAGLTPIDPIDMPANNVILVYRSSSGY